MRARTHVIPSMLATCAVAAMTLTASAQTRVWDSRDLWWSSPTSSDARDRLGAAFAQFADGGAYLAILTSAACAIVLSSALAFLFRSKGAGDGDLDERKGLVLVGLAASVAAALCAVQPAVALVFVALALALRGQAAAIPVGLRLRALFILVVSIAAGLDQFLIAVVLTPLALALLKWMGSQRQSSIKVRLALGVDLARARAVVTSTLARMNCSVLSSREGRSGRTLTFAVRMPGGVTDELLLKGLAATLNSELGPVEVELMAEAPAGFR
jgi:hypothetical protein